MFTMMNTVTVLSFRCPIKLHAVKAYETAEVEIQASLSSKSDAEEISFTLSWQRNTGHLDRMLDDLYRRPGCGGEEKNHFPCPVLNSSCPVRSLGKAKFKLALVWNMTAYGGTKG